MSGHLPLERARLGLGGLGRNAVLSPAGVFAERLIADFRHELLADTRSRAFRDLVLKAPVQSLTQAPVQAVVMGAAIDLMPDFARKMHGLSRPVLPPMVRGATFGLASTIRWAFAGENYRATH